MVSPAVRSSSGRRSAPEAQARWRAVAERTARAVRERMWDPASELFFDVDPARGHRTGVKAAVCFYPYATDLTGEAHIPGMERHLFNREEFWTPFPVPSSSCDDPRFNPMPNGTARHNCPWNGRVWPMTNSHVADALGRVVREHRPDWAPKLGRFLMQFVRMMTFDGRDDRPNCFEHYHPVTGRGSLYRGIDDYQHSWINDLFVSHLLGVLPHGVTADRAPAAYSALVRRA
jgi:glycogen debranching enzyme